MKNLFYRALAFVYRHPRVLVVLSLATLIVAPSVVEAQQYTCGTSASNPCWTPEGEYLEAFLVLILMYLMPGGSLISWT